MNNHAMFWIEYAQKHITLKGRADVYGMPTQTKAEDVIRQALACLDAGLEEPGNLRITSREDFRQNVTDWRVEAMEVEAAAAEALALVLGRAPAPTEIDIVASHFRRRKGDLAP